jgi:uncharacterized protein with ParB-like and HNH nuclease domain
MSNLIDSSITIYEAMKNIENGKYVMPAFQREYVWSSEQIEKLWDSILLDYPISNFLFWHIDDSNVTWDTYFCNFLKRVTFNNSKQAIGVNFPINSIDFNYTDIAILDGQQRLTSLYLSLLGDTYIKPKFAKKQSGVEYVYKLFIELDKNKCESEDEDYNSKKYDIKFTTKGLNINSSSTQFEIRNILSESFQNDETREQTIEDIIKDIPENSKDYARDILKKLYNKIFVEKLIRYTEIKNMSQDDALEMFIRFNNGGKKLRKHEITMSILEVYWPNAREQFSMLLSGPYSEFNTDLIIRTALMLYGDVTKTIINKKVADNLKNNWSDFKIAFKNLNNAFEKLNIDIRHFINDYTKLVPLIYHIYNNPYTYEQDLNAIRVYLTRTIFFIYFRSGTPGKLQRLKTNINNNNMKISIDMLDTMAELQITDSRIEDILNSEKGSRLAEEVLYFIGRDWINTNINYEQDHLHPESRFQEPKPFSVSNEEWKNWYINRNRLPNIQLLDEFENKSKNSRRLIDYCNDMNEEQKEEFYKRALIPKDTSLEIEHFGEFYEARKNMLKEKILELLK